MKSIDDYKKIVITLKKKVRSLQQENDDLKRFKSNEVYIYVDKFIAAQQLKKSANQLGLTPEMLFRAADTNCMEIIKTDRLAEILKKITKLHDNYIKELIEMFDVEDSKSITKDEYYQTLEMYQINEEYGTNYNRNSYAKFIYFLKQEKFDGQLGFLMMDPSRQGYITRDMFITFTQNLKNWQDYISLREINAAFLYLDVSKNDTILKQDYLRAFDKLPSKPDPYTLQEQKINTLRKVLLIKGIRLSELILKLMLSIKQPEYGITIQILENLFNEKEKKDKLEKKDILILFKLMDLRQKGSLDYDEIMTFYYMTMSYGDSFEIVFAVLARKLQAINTSIQKYLKKEQIYPETILTFQDFDQIAYDLFNVPNSDISYRLFNALDLDNSGTVSAQEIITFTTDSLKNFNLSLRQETKTQQTEIFVDFDSTQIEIANLDNEEQLLFELKQYKTQITQQDIFQEFQYIFTNEISCLIACLEIVQNLKKNKITNWSDPEFGPNSNDPFGSKSIFQSENLTPSGWPDAKDIEWLRIQDLSLDWVFLDEQGANASDVIQSHYLGDCWLISALAIIARNDKYLIDTDNISKGLYPQLFHFLSKYGIFVIKFYKMHRDIYVMVDDRFCTYNNKLLFAECRSPNEWWVQIIEKAYAKLHQCYESLTSGDISQALFDLTGIPCTRYQIIHDDADLLPIITPSIDKKKGKSPQIQNIQELNLQTVRERNEKLKKILKDGQNQNSLMGCSAHGTGQIILNGEETGLYRGHAYSLLHFFQLKDTENVNHQLAMLKNPWGFGEWKLKWSDNSKEMEQNCDLIDEYFTQEIQRCKEEGKEAPDVFTKEEDGIFLMNFKSFRNVFDVLFKSINLNDNWSVLRIKDKFQPEHYGSPQKSEKSKIYYACRNPKYKIIINHPFYDKHLYITFNQKDQRLNCLQKYPYENKMMKVIICLFHINVPETDLKQFDIEKKVADSKILSSRRDIDIEMISVQNGTYILIPSADRPGIVGEYVISIYFDFPPNGIKVESNTDQQFLLQPKEFNSLMQNQTLLKLYQKL